MVNPYQLLDVVSVTVWTILAVEPNDHPMIGDTIYIDLKPVGIVSNVQTLEPDTFNITSDRHLPYTVIGSVLHIGA